MGEGGISTQRPHAPTWLRLEGLFCSALLVPSQGAPAIVDLRQKVDEKRVARLCVAVARSNALLTAWQALALALVEPEFREAIADSEALAKLDAIFGDAPALAAWFEPSVRSAAVTELRAMIDNAVVFPAVQFAMLSQWFDKPVARLAALASEHLALQLEAHGMRALPFVLGLPSSPAFRELAAQSSAQLRRLSTSLTESSMRQPAPSLTDRWIADLYTEARHLGRARSDVVPRSDAAESRVRSAESLRGSGPARIAPLRAPSIAVSNQKTDELSPADDAREPSTERAIDEEWMTLAERLGENADAARASSDEAPRDGAPRLESPRSESKIALIPQGSRGAALDRAAPSSPSEIGEVSTASAIAREQPGRGKERRTSVHLGLATFSGALAGAVSVAMFMVLADRDDRRPAPVPLPSVPSAADEPLAVVALVAMDKLPAPERSSPTAGPVASPAVTPNSPNSRSCDLSLMYAQRGEIAQAIRRFENCLSPERESVRQRIGQRAAVEVRANAEKGQCDQAAAIVAQVESVEAAGAAKVAFASLCASRAREVETETSGR